MEGLNRYICLFGGGAIRGVAHVGVVKALEELKIEPSIIGGSSVGAIIAMLYSVGYSNDEMAQVFMDVDFELFRDFSFGFNQKFAVSKGEIFLDWLRELIEKKYYGDAYKKGEVEPVKFKDISKPLVIFTTNIKNFTGHEFSTFETPDFEIAKAVRISCCMPGLMSAVQLESEVLVDGDLQKGKPMWSLSNHLRDTKDNILEIRLEGEVNDVTKPLNYINGMYSCITNSETEFIKSIYGQNDKYEYIVINAGDVVVVDFNYPKEKRKMLMDSGYQQTINYFKGYLVEKRKKLLEIYTYINDKLIQVLSLITRRKYYQAKFTMCELFTYLIDVKDLISIDIYKLIKIIQQLLVKNIKKALFGSSTCENKELIIVQLKQVISELDTKEKLYSEYLTLNKEKL